MLLSLDDDHIKYALALHKFNKNAYKYVFINGSCT